MSGADTGKQTNQVISPAVLPGTTYEEDKGEYEDEYHDDGLAQDHIIGSSHTVEAAKIALKNSAKTLIKIDGKFRIDLTIL